MKLHHGLTLALLQLAAVGGAALAQEQVSTEEMVDALNGVDARLRKPIGT